MEAFSQLQILNNIPGIITGGSDDDDVTEAPRASTHSDINQSVVNELVALIRKRNREGFRELVLATKCGGLHMDCGGIDADGNTVMHLAVMSGDEEIVHAAVAAGASVNKYENCDGETPLTLAALQAPSTFAIMLREAKKPKAQRVNSRGQNLLHSVVTAKATARPWPDRLLMVRELIETHNVSIKQCDNNGLTPAAWAREHNLGLGNDSPAIIDLLSRSQSKRMNATKAELVTFFKSPAARILTVVVLFVLHNIQYAMDTADRPTFSSALRSRTVVCMRPIALPANPCVWYSDDVTMNLTAAVVPANMTLRIGVIERIERISTPLRPGEFPYVFFVFNVVASNWHDTSTNVIAAHMGCLILGGLIGAFVGGVVVAREVIGRRLGALRIFGVDDNTFAQRANSNAVVSFEDGIASVMEEDAPPHASHGFVVPCLHGCFAGIFCGGLLFNYFLTNFFPEFRSRAAILDTIDGVDSIVLLRGCWVATLIIDLLVLVVVWDTMLQCLANNVAIPDPTYSGFGSVFYPMLSKWRLIWTWLLLPLLWLGVMIGVGVRSKIAGGINAFLEPLVGSSTSGQPLAVAGLSVCFCFLVMIQDWTLPFRRMTPQLLFPGLLEYSTNMMWLLWFLVSLTLTMDFRLLVRQIRVFVDREDLTSGLKRFELSMALLPPFVGVVVFLVAVMRTSVKLGPRRGAAYGGDDETRTQSQAAGPTGSGGGGGGGGNPRPASSSGNKRLAKSTPPTANGSSGDITAPARPPSSQSNKRSLVNDIWTAAAADDVIKLCTLLEKDSALINARGGPGIECDISSQSVQILPPSARGGAEYSAAPLHYALVAGARSTATALLSRGANPRLRTTHGMFSCKELVAMSKHKNMAELLE